MHHYLSRLIGILCFAVILFSSCKSKKQVSSSDRNKSNNTCKQLSERLNLDIKPNDHLALYQFVSDWLGTPHALGKCDKTAIDCSCFVQLLYQNIFQYKLPRNAHDMYKQCKRVISDHLQEGNLVFFNIKSDKTSHVGVYLKEGWFVHVSVKKGVMINNLNEAYYQKYFIGGGSVN
jgi:lipoprotein Spr